MPDCQVSLPVQEKLDRLPLLHVVAVSKDGHNSHWGSTSGWHMSGGLCSSTSLQVPLVGKAVKWLASIGAKAWAAGTSQAACAVVGHCLAAVMLCGLNSSWPRPCSQAQRWAASRIEHRSLIRCCSAGGLEAPDPNNTRPMLRGKLPATQDAPAGTGSLPAAALTERGGRAPASQPLQQSCSAGNSSRPASGGVPAPSGAQAPARQAPHCQRRSSAGTACAPAGGLGERGTEAPGEQGAQDRERHSTAGAVAVHTARPPQSSEWRGSWPARLMAPHGTSCLQHYMLPALRHTGTQFWEVVRCPQVHPPAGSGVCALFQPRQGSEAPLLRCVAGARVPAGGALQAGKTTSGSCTRVLAKLGLQGGSMGGSRSAANAEPPAASGEPQPSVRPDPLT